MLPANLQLSQKETDLIKNTEWILSKHVITKKVYSLFGEISEQLKVEVQPFNYLFPENIINQSGKISKGENYRLLPYVILDYPAFFWKDRIFAVRTMFWWGNFFSVTLHLSGIHKEKFLSDPGLIFPFLREKNFYISIGEDEWQHHFEPDNFVEAKNISIAEFQKIAGKQFFKISKKIPVSEWNNAPEFILDSFREIMQFLRISYPAGKTDLLPGFPKAGSDL